MDGSGQPSKTDGFLQFPLSVFHMTTVVKLHTVHVSFLYNKSNLNYYYHSFTLETDEWWIKDLFNK